jgi:hypothetical protein
MNIDEIDEGSRYNLPHLFIGGSISPSCNR